MKTVEIEYNPTTWRNLKLLAKRIGRKTFGNNDKKAMRFARLIAWQLGEPKPFEMFHPKTGEMRSITYTPTSYADCCAGIYIEQ